MKLISKSWSNLTPKVSLPSPLVVLLTERFNVSLDNLNLTPSFLSSDTDATLSIDPKNDFKFVSNFFWLFFGITCT